MAKRQAANTARRKYRRANTIFKKLAEFEGSTGWSGFLVLKEKGSDRFVYGGSSAELMAKFEQGQALTEKPTPTNSSKVSLSKIMNNIVASGKKVIQLSWHMHLHP